jgi:PAS domain S-box-containing protein
VRSGADLSSELAEARRRLAELEAAEAERRHAEKVQSALYRIAELASAAQDMQEFYRAMHAVVGELMYANNFFIALYDEERQLISWPYYVDEIDLDIPDPNAWDAFGSGNARGTTALVLRTGQPQLFLYEQLLELAAQGEIEIVGATVEDETWLGVPLTAEGRTLGVLVVQSYTKDVEYTEQDKDLLAFVGQHVGAALSRARAIEETRQRNAELALINTVQEALAGELELQAIYDVVGDKIRDIFDAQVVDIAVYDRASGLFHFPYSIERGVHYPEAPLELIGFRRQVMETRDSLLINEDVEGAAKRYGNPLLSGEMPKSVLYVPLVAGGKATGVISLQNIDREHAFSDSDVQLLETLARSLSVALENARLVHETRQRNAELALINTVQEALAGELELQAIYDVVGEKIRDVFDAQVVDIGIYDEAAELFHFPYTIERGVRFPDEPLGLIGFRKHVMERREPMLINEDVVAASDRYGNPQVLTGEPAKSLLFVPLVAGGKATGVISLQNVDREHAFSDSDVQLLDTLARSLSVALENARLVHETRQRNAELALINSVQESLAGELEMQAIYDAVGDKIQEIFDAQVVDIGIFDFDAGVTRYPYAIERGVRLPDAPVSITGSPNTQQLLATKAPVLINDVPAWERERGESLPVPVGEPALSVLVVPLMSGEEFRGRISLQNLDRTNVFTESDVRLLTTLAGSLSVALENARLVHETRQRNAELALINSVQDAIAGELDPQAIYDLVGGKLQEVFDAQVVSVSILDEATGLLQFPYVIERGERLQEEPIPLIGFRKHVIETREPLMIEESMPEVAERYGNPYVLSGEPVKSALFVPLVVGGRATGVISLQNVDRTHAFSDSDQRLLTTLCGSLSVALENARLVHETRQRNAELALINSVQDSIAGELDPQAIYDLVGEKLREVFDAQVVDIAVHDEEAELLRFVYQIERGVQYPNLTLPVIGFRKHVMETRAPLAILENIDAALVEYGNPETVVGEPSHGSAIFQPLVVGGRATGVVSIQNLDREHAFSESDQRLLATIAGSLGVALENAQLIHETRQRVSELATVNSVGQALSTQLELAALIELVGERVRETFAADIAYVALHDEATGQIDFVYYYEAGERGSQTPLQYGEGLTSQILETREPLLLIREEQYEGLDSVGTPSKSYVGVPILAGDKAIGVISVQSTSEQGRFAEPDVRLLATIASNVGVAIQNARLFAEIERQREHFESLVDISPVAVVVMDADERVTGWNPAAAELFGHTAEEAVGRLVDDLVFGDDIRDEGREITREALTNGQAQRITRRRRKDGTAVDVELMLVPLLVDDARVGFLGVYHDITELQRAREEAEAATQAKSAFLATMSHEIRTPMNAVIGMTGLLLSTDLTPEQREFAEVVRSSGDALLHVIDDILDYSKIEAGKLELEKEPVALRDCVEEALDIVAPRAWEKKIELGCLIDEEAPAGIVGDGGRLRQILLNLLSNAVKFTEEGEVIVQVDGERTGASSYRLEFVVRDTGIGIPRDRMDTLFESFSQVDASTTRRYGGTGLGLAISKRLVDLMGGTMWVESEEGKGSTFHIVLGVEAAEAPTRTAMQDALPQLAGKRILIVDDNATNREIVARHARSWGMEPVAVDRASEALARIEAGETFDVAVLDMLMPEMDGLALAGEIRRHRNERELPLVLLTSLGRLPGAQSSGAFAVQLAKPVKASQLYNALVKAVAAHEQEPEAAGLVPEEGHVATSSLRILLAEDNAVNQKVALHLLDQLGYRADVASNGLEALDALERRSYDVVLMDVQMPELDGLDASRRICERWPAAKRPRIIAMTANALPEDREECFEAGMDDYVAKPIRPNELAEALSRARPAGETVETSADGGRALDASAVESLKELGGDGFLAEVIDTFLSEGPALLATLRASHERGEAEVLRRTAHTLKSNGQTFGATGFSELCRELEQRAKNGEVDGAAELLDRIEREYRALEQALAALRPEPAS